MQLITYDRVKSKIIEIRNQKVMLDSDVAGLYGVETKAINQAIKRNSDKFPGGYLIELTSDE
ncbi:MAG: ORF6N domain-containing protein [Gammaproteobacteria bacterium]|nr:ORF6N domain-containing protein [Gammaproteobacteria bacterium]